MTDLQRLNIALAEAFKSRGIYKKGDMAHFLGYKFPYFSGVINGKEALSEKFLDEISDSLSINKDWILTGEGEMLTTPDDSSGPTNGEGYNRVPVYNFDAVGGMDKSNDITDAPAYIERYVPFPGARKDDICVHVTGNSMIPAYSSGSLLLIRKVEGWREYFGYGHCYVLMLKDGRRILKEVRKSEVDHKKYILCFSHNPNHQPEELPRNFIVDVYKVVMTLTNEGY